MVYNFVFCIFIIFLSTETLSDDINILSDKLEIIRTDNISIFTGNVHAYEKDLEIWSEKLVITSSENEENIEEITANGDIKIIRNDVTIHGNQARYDTINNLLFVYGNVEVNRNKNIIVCDELILDLENSTSIMKSKSKKRVEATIFNN